MFNIKWYQNGALLQRLVDQCILKLDGGGSQGSSLEPYDQVVKVG
jgi:hypothetical protein